MPQPRINRTAEIFTSRVPVTAAARYKIIIAVFFIVIIIQIIVAIIITKYFLTATPIASRRRMAHYHVINVTVTITLTTAIDTFMCHNNIFSFFPSPQGRPGGAPITGFYAC